MRLLRLSLLLALAAALHGSRGVSAADRETQVRKDLENVLAGGRWIYNDLERGLKEARESRKPLLVVIRCIPCDACKGFDEQVASFNPRVQKLLERFVRVRIPQSNGLDLSLFQFDFDLSFAAFFLNADRTIYGRFGSRSTQQDKTGEVSLDAFVQAMTTVLDLHERFDQVKESLKGKTGGPVPHAVPEDHPLLKGKYTSKIDYEKAPVKSCIHCHQIRDSERQVFRTARQPLPDAVMYPWPLPDAFGLALDPRKRASVSSVEAGSAADKAGFRAGDELLLLQGQPLISIADVQWVLHEMGEEGELASLVKRSEEKVPLKAALEKGWRKRTDVSWRATTWELRRMGAGGLQLEELPAEERRKAGLEKAMALRVRHAGEYGEHATAKKAGFRKGDVIVSVDGRTDPWRETDLLAYAMQSRLPGDRVAFVVLRDGQRKEISFELH